MPAEIVFISLGRVMGEVPFESSPGNSKVLNPWLDERSDGEVKVIRYLGKNFLLRTLVPLSLMPLFFFLRLFFFVII